MKNGRNEHNHKKIEELFDASLDAPLEQYEIADVQEQAPWATRYSEPKNHGVYQPPGYGVSDKPSQGSGDEVYEGTVRLCVETHNSFQTLIQFMRALRWTPDFRLLGLVGNHKGRVNIWLRLRLPLRLKEVLLQMEGVTHVDTPIWVDHESAVNVQLAKAPLLGQPCH